MSTENTPVEQVDTSLDDFSAEFFGQNNAEADTAKSEQVEAEAPESDAPTIEDTHEESTDDVTSDVEDDDANDETTDTEAEKPKKSRFQERIDELTAKAREAERKAEEMARKLQEIEAKSASEPKTPAPEPKTTAGPNPDDLNEDGTEKYPLGEFDPNYLKDFVAFQFEQRESEAKERAQKEAEQAKLEAEVNALRQGWNQKLEPAKERYPDFVEKGQSLIDSFNDLDQGYAEFLTTTLMSMDHGPDVFYHLANNPQEAKAIVNGGPIKAAIAFGGLNARFAVSSEEMQGKQTSRPKVSKAPTPPSRINKGSSAAMPEVPGDTDDLDAFERELFKPRRR